MLNLIIKDILLIRRSIWLPAIYSFMIFFIMPMSNGNTVAYTMGISMITYLMIMYVSAYDDKNNSEVIINSLPITRNQIVISRYLSVLVFLAIGIGFMFVAGSVLNVFNVEMVTRTIQWGDVIGAAIAMLILNSIYLPLLFKFSYIKAKMFNLVIMAILFLLPVFTTRLLKTTSKPKWLDTLVTYTLTTPEWIQISILFGIAFSLTLISLSMSIRFYNKRQF